MELRQSRVRGYFQLMSNSTPVLSNQFGRMFYHHTGVSMDRNKSICVTLIPRDGNFLSVYSITSIISINNGDFVGALTGHPWCSEDFDKVYGIGGPTKFVARLFRGYWGFESDDSCSSRRVCKCGSLMGTNRWWQRVALYVACRGSGSP